MAISKLILNGEVQMDVTSDTVEANKLLSGETATKNDGTKVTGTYIPPDPVISSLTVTPTESAQTFDAAGISGYKPVTVGAIASDYVGSAIPMRSSEDVYFIASQARIPSGYYSTLASSAMPYAEISKVSPYDTFDSSTGRLSYGFAVTSSGYANTKTDTGTFAFATLSAQTITPTESTQYISSYKWLTGSQTIEGISSEYIGSAVPKKSSTDLTANGSTVTAPAGYYSTAATKNISGGSAIPPAVTITKAPTFTMNSATGVVTASYSGSSTVTPTVTAGYISQGTAGTISTSGTSTYQLTSKAAATIYPSTADQTISSYRWLTGTQTIKSVTTSNLTAANIKSGVVVRVGDATNSSRITQITGTYSAPTPTISALTVTPTTTAQTFNATGVSGYKPVTVNAIPSSYIIPTGTSSITSNGVYDIGDYKSVDVNVAGGGGDVNAFIMRSFSSTVYENSTLTEIGPGAFAYATTLSGVSIPNVTTIGSFAFYGCKLDFSRSQYDFQNVISINDYAFFQAFSGAYVVLNSNKFPKAEYIGKYAFADAYISGSRTAFPNVSYLGEGAFYDGDMWSFTWLSSENFPKLKYIGSHAFVNAESLSSVSLPLVEYVGDSAFCSTTNPARFSGSPPIASYTVSSNTRLRSVALPNCSMIGSGAFHYCTYLSYIEFPLCTSIGMSAFKSCYSLSLAIDFSECTYIGADAFTSCNIPTISLPECSYIGMSAFASCKSLTTVDLSKCETIYTQAFVSCTSLTSISAPMCSSIGIGAFSGCSQLTEAIFSECTYIASNAFSNCSNLTTAIFPKCTTISSSAFFQCSKLSVISFPECVSIGARAFYGCSSLVAVSFPECTNIATSSPFSNCPSISNVYMPKLSSLPGNTFQYNTNLTHVYIDQCMYIGTNAFWGCTKLISLYLTQVSSIPSLYTGVFASTPIAGNSTYAGQYGSVYVPASLYNDFLTATNWSSISARIVSV